MQIAAVKPYCSSTETKGMFTSAYHVVLLTGIYKTIYMYIPQLKLAIMSELLTQCHFYVS